LLTVYADLPTGFGIDTQVSGCKRILFGADKLQQFYPPQPVRTATAVMQFFYPTDPIYPPDPICPLSRGGPIFLKLNLTFADNGKLQNLACTDCPPVVKVRGLDSIFQ